MKIGVLLERKNKLDILTEGTEFGSITLTLDSQELVANTIKGLEFRNIKLDPSEVEISEGVPSEGEYGDFVLEENPSDVLFYLRKKDFWDAYYEGYTYTYLVNNFESKVDPQDEESFITKDGSKQMLLSYFPQNDFSVVTKKFLEIMAASTKEHKMNPDYVPSKPGNIVDVKFLKSGNLIYKPTENPSLEFEIYNDNGIPKLHKPKV